MTQPAQDVLSWVRRQMADITSAGIINRIELWHAVDGEGAERLETFMNSDDVEDVDEVARLLWEVAEHDATTRSMGMRQRYVLLAFRSEEESDSRHPFTITPNPTMRGAASFTGDTVSPDQKGIVGQVLAHDQHMHGMMMGMTEATAGRLMRENQLLSKQLESNQQMLANMFETHQELLDRKHERDMEAAREQAKARRHEELMGMLLSMAPLVVGRLMGGMPGSNARDFSVGKFFAGLSEEEVMGVIGSLKGANQLAAMELYKSYREDDEKEQAKKHPLLRDKGPEDEPPGEPRH